MKTRRIYFMILIIVSILFSACARGTATPEVTAGAAPEQETEAPPETEGLHFASSG